VKSIVVALMILTTPVANSAGLADKLVGMRPTVEKFLGTDIANKIWGAKDNVVLPTIPKIVNDTTSTDVYSKKKDPKANLFTGEKKEGYDYSFVSEVVQATREVKANRNEIAKWMGTLSQGATREGVYRALVLDSYYARLENYSDPLSPSAQKFAITFMKKFIGKDVTADKIKDLNVYTIKRIMTERALDIIDIFLSKNEEDLYSWYGVLSRDLAEFKIWKSKIRGNNKATLHKRWAKKMPVQFIKSEVIIKIHKLMNKLQKRN